MTTCDFFEYFCKLFYHIKQIASYWFHSFEIDLAKTLTRVGKPFKLLQKCNAINFMDWYAVGVKVPATRWYMKFISLFGSWKLV